MKSTVETLSPTRVRLAVEVPFDELQPSLKKAYREIAQQVRIPGFRPGKAPARLIDQRVGRAAVLEEAVNDVIPEQYTAAVREHEVKVVGQPKVDVTEFNDGQDLKFTAEVDVRPELELPAYDTLTATVDDVQVGDEQVDEQLGGLQDRFAVLNGVERPVQNGDFVSVDLHATVDGEEVEGGSTTGMSYEVGSGQLLPGLDEALVGMQSGESKTFQTELVAGEHADQTADVAVTVRSVKEKEVPDLDDDFAQTASEFDTIGELRDDVRSRLERVNRMQQGFQARDRVLEALLAAVDIPLPESVVENELEYRRHAMHHELENAGLTLEGYLQSEGREQDELDDELREAAEQAVKAQLVLDAVADKEEIGVNDTELTEELVRRAQQSGIAPDEYARQLIDAGQLPMLAADVRRGKALALVIESAKIVDESGNPVDLEALQRDVAAGPGGPVSGNDQQEEATVDDTKRNENDGPEMSDKEAELAEAEAESDLAEADVAEVNVDVPGESER